MKPELIGTNWRAVGAHRNPSSRKFKKPTAIDYKILACRFEAEDKTDLMNIALDEAFHISQKKGRKDGN